MFLGLALSSASPPQNAEAEKAYRKAVTLSPKQVLAWQGLVTLYEKQGKWDEMAETQMKVLEVLAEG